MMEAHKPGDARCNGAVVTDHVEITFAQWLAGLLSRICRPGSPDRRTEPDVTATGVEHPQTPHRPATSPEQPPVGPTTDSEQPGNEEAAASCSEPPPDGTARTATEAAEATGSGDAAEGRGGGGDEEERLPEDYQDILRRLVAPVKFSSRKELEGIFRKNLLIDDSSASFTLGRSDKKCYMFSARDFGITWIHERKYWRRWRYTNSRFPEVVLLVDVCWFTLHCKFNLKDLSEHTTYSVLLVYECTDDLDGLQDTQECLITVGGRESRRRVRLGYLEEEEEDDDDEEEPPAMSMAPSGVPRMRPDEWMEVEVGELAVEERRDQIVEVHVKEIQRLNWKRGIIVEGIELRAKHTLESVIIN